MLIIEKKQKLDDTTITAEVKYSINFTASKKKFCLSLHYNRNNRFLYVNGAKIYQFKPKFSEIKPYPLCLGNNSIGFTTDNIKNRINWIRIQFFCRL